MVAFLGFIQFSGVFANKNGKDEKSKTQKTAQNLKRIYYS
jgi:hypothetical protein